MIMTMIMMIKKVALLLMIMNDKIKKSLNINLFSFGKNFVFILFFISYINIYIYYIYKYLLYYNY